MNYIPVNEPLLDGNEKKYLNECIDSGWISSEGPFVQKFQNAFSSYIGTEYGIAVSSGTAALETALYALGLNPGDEVIMPSFTIISCAVACIRLGIKPVLVDIDPITWTMNVEAVEGLITPKTRAIMAVHIYGHSVHMDRLLELRDKYEVFIIEDAAEAHGAEYLSAYSNNSWLKCGSMGDVSITSFYANKIVTTGEGGMVLTNNPDFAERANSFRNLCFGKQERFNHADIGYNFRMTNLQAAVGLAQCEQLERFVSIKRELSSYYAQKLSNLQSLRFMEVMPWARSVYWMYAVELNSDSQINAGDLIQKLKKHKIGTRPFFKGMHAQEALKSHIINRSDAFTNTDHAYKKGLYLPSGLTLQKNQIDYIVNALERELN